MIFRTLSNSENTDKAVILLHGWRGSLTSMEPIAKSLNIKQVKWFFLQAPYLAKDGGFSWFDGNNDFGWDKKKSFGALNKLINKINMQGFPKSSIFILGFSQGACIAMEFIIRQTFSIGGIIPIAGFIRFKKEFKNDVLDQSKDTSILLIHGKKDEVVPPEQSIIAKKLFQEQGYSVEVHLFSAKHKFPLQAKNLIHDFIINH